MTTPRRKFWEKEGIHPILGLVKKAGKMYLYGLSKPTSMNQDNEKGRHAETIIRNHVIWSMGAGLIPVLIADIFAVSALQLDMIRQLCKVYSIDFAETQGKAIVTSLTGSTLARLTAGSVAKLVPGLGSVLGGFTVSIFAGASTYALGQVFRKHFAEGGTILDFDPERLRKLYREQFEKGKQMAEEWKKKETESPASSYAPGASANPAGSAEGDAIQRLRDLAALRDQGILTDEEFQAMKRKILES